MLNLGYFELYDWLTPVFYFSAHKYSKDPSLSEWVHRQRVKYVEFQKWKNQGTASAPVSKKKKSFADPELLEARFQKLQEIGFPFTVQLGKWMDNWNMLKEFKEKNGVSIFHNMCLHVIMHSIFVGFD